MTEPHDHPRPARRSWIPGGSGALALALAGAALFTGAIIAMREPVTPARYAVTDPPPAPYVSYEALADTLARCRTASAGTADTECHAAWEAHRKHFFGSPPSSPAGRQGRE